MKLYKLERKQKVNKPLSEIFAFFEDPGNLAKLTPASLDFRILTPEPIIMKEGLILDYTVKVALIPIRWTTYIAEYKSNQHFVDLQLKGPYSYWHHTHKFYESDGGTIIDDSVVYALPFGFLGQLCHTIFVKKQLAQIFAFREKAIKDLFN